MNLAVGSIGYITFKGKTIRNLAKISEWDNPNKVNIYSQS
jgi:hypothetical protein